MAREAICTRDKDGLNSENVGVKDVTDSTRDLSSHVYVESWRDRVRVPHWLRTLLQIESVRRHQKRSDPFYATGNGVA